MLIKNLGQRYRTVTSPRFGSVVEYATIFTPKRANFMMSVPPPPYGPEVIFLYLVKVENCFCVTDITPYLNLTYQ